VRRALLLVPLVPLLLYARTAGFGFVNADDVDLIAGNQRFLSDLRNAPRAFERSYFEVEGEPAGQKTYYRPVAIVSFMLDAARGGAQPRAYHVTNVILHAIVTCLVFALARAWGAAANIALAAALVFAVHPLNVQAVAWVAARNDLLVAVFGVVALLAWNAMAAAVAVPVATAEAVALRGTTARRHATARTATAGSAMAGSAMALAIASRTTVPTIAIHLLAFALAVFSKETGLLFPLLAVAHQRLVLRRPLTRPQAVALAGDGVVVAVWAVLRTRALAGMPSEVTPDVLRSAFGQLPQILAHAGKMLIPARLNVSPGVDLWSAAIGTVAVTAFAWAAWRWLAGRQALFAAGWALLLLAPTLLVPGMPAYEHRAYVPMIGLLAASSGGLAFAPGTGRSRTRAWIALAAMLVTFAALAYQRQDVFRDPFSYWSDGARDARFGPIAHVNLGQLHEAAGRPLEARREYLRALERDPDTPKAHNNLGVVLMALDEPALALHHFTEETRRHPWNADAWFNLGLWHETRGAPAEARRYFERAVAQDPHYAPAHEKLRQR
jgi:hypothetical protein